MTDYDFIDPEAPEKRAENKNEKDEKLAELFGSNIDEDNSDNPREMPEFAVEPGIKQYSITERVKQVYSWVTNRISNVL